MKHINIENISRLVIQPMAIASLAVIMALLATYIETGDYGPMVNADDFLGAVLRLYAVVAFFTLTVTAVAEWRFRIKFPRTNA